MIGTTAEVGKLGEQLAKEYLQKKGYRIVERNYRTRRAEIDLVATKGPALVFVEVRTKSNEEFGTPEETINGKKKMKLLRNAAAYVSKLKYRGQYQIDAICIVLDAFGKPLRIRHYESIVE